MILIKIKFLLLIFIFYQSPIYSKSNSFDDFNSRNLSKYFSGIIAFENKDNTKALNFFNSSKNLINLHDPYLKRYIYSLVLEDKIPLAIKLIKKNKFEDNSDFFDARLLLIIDSLKKKDFDQAYLYSSNNTKFRANNKFNLAILENLEQYTFVFKERQILKNTKNFGKLSKISETFQRCFLDDKNTDAFFSNLFNDIEVDYTRYIFFYLSYLVSKNKFEDTKKVVADINYINSTLLLSQGKSWVERSSFKKFQNVFFCKDHLHVMGEFLFLISNLYSSQDNYEKSNYYLYLSNFLNPKFVYNLSLISENYYLNKNYAMSKKILKNFDKEDDLYFWYRKKKEAQIISKKKNKQKSLKFIQSEFDKIDKPNNKMIFDLANFYKNAKNYDIAIKYYSIIIENLNENSEIKSDLLYRRGGSYERKGDYINADKDLLSSLSIDPDDAYVLNYLAYSWLERNFKIEEAIEMLKTAYDLRSDDPYIIDSIGWAYYLVEEYFKAEEFLKRAVELMPDDPIVNDHYGDILWKLDQKIQARYFWNNVLKMEDVEIEMIDEINSKLIRGPKNS